MSDTPEIIQQRLTKSKIAADVLRDIAAHEKRDAEDAIFKSVGPEPRVSVIVEASTRFPGGATQARNLILYAWYLSRGVAPRPEILPITPAVQDLPPLEFSPNDEISDRTSLMTDHFLFGRLTVSTLDRLSNWRALVQDSDRPVQLSPVYKIWRNHPTKRFVYESARTVKCDAARAAFGATGRDIIWAVADTGVDGGHPHFATHDTLTLPPGLEHQSFLDDDPDPLSDLDGHGTHVAGIIAGETRRREKASQTTRPKTIAVHRQVRETTAAPEAEKDTRLDLISGVAPMAKILSLKVVDAQDVGEVGHILAAIGYIQRANNYGRDIRIHGLNLSVGYDFDPNTYAAGQSPLCAEVNRLVRSGVMVVVAAGNGGYGQVQTSDGENFGMETASHLGTICDPGNADLALTVGSTHRDMPHTFGVSFFSGKGPTADGRMKPDLVAPGERIVSCAPMSDAEPGEAPFMERSGTSMAAPHVSGAAAAFMSVRREFRGHPDRLKAILIDSATDLKRRAEYQGAGLVDLMRALQSV